MKVKNASEFQEKHARRLKGAIEDMRKGVENVTEAPTKKAAEKADKMLANLTASVQSGKWQRGLNNVSLEEWKDKTINKGINRVAAGIDAAAPKVVAFAEQLLPHIESGQNKVKKMADVTFEDSLARMVEFSRHMKGFKKK